MYPYIHLLGRDLPSYSLMAAIGFGVALLAVWLNTHRRDDVDQTQIVHIALAAVCGLVIGGHLLYGIVNLRVFAAAAKDGFSQIHSLWEMAGFVGSVFGGMVFYGGLIGAVVGALWYLQAMKLPFSPYVDILAFSIPLFHGFARIGCFLAGCCYGIESKYGFVYHHALSEAANGVSRFPVQLLETGLDFTLFIGLLMLFRKKKFQDKLLYIYLTAYSVLRFCDEFLRGDAQRGFVGVLSTSQFISLMVWIVSIGLLIQSSRSHSQSENI